MVVLASGRAGGHKDDKREVGRIVRRRSLMGLRKACLCDFGGLGAIVSRVHEHTACLPTSDVQAWLKSREPAGPAVKSHAWARPSAGLIRAGSSAQLAARP